ncbi:MAG: MOSC domain-containing protein [Paracoccaceae bacterium]
MAKTPDNPVTAEELATALPDVLAAPRDAGPIRLLCARPKPNARTFPDTLTLTRTEGVAGDFEMSRPWLTLPDGRPDPRIQVSILPARVLDLCWRERDRIAHPGDNIVVDMNLTHENLPTGTLLALGTAILRISDVPNDGCVKWKVRQGKAAFDWVVDPAHAALRLRGLFCSVEQDGVVGLGDVIRRR